MIIKEQAMERHLSGYLQEGRINKIDESLYYSQKQPNPVEQVRLFFRLGAFITIHSL